MAYEDKCRARVLEMIFKPLNRLNIQVVCRLIKNHEIGLGRKQSGQRRLSALAAGRARSGRFGVEIQPARRQPYLVGLVRWQVGGCKAAQRVVAIHIHLLLQVSNRYRARLVNDSFVRFDQTRDQPGERGFARAVAAGHCNLVSEMNFQVGIGKYCRRSDFDRNTYKVDE